MTQRKDFPVRLPVVLGLLTVLAVGLGLGVWGSVVSLAGAIIAPGLVEVEQNRQVVQHLDGGVVKKIKVVDGSAVDAGDVLIELDGSLLRSDLAIVENQLFEVLARRARLEAERDAAPTVAFPEPLMRAAAERPEVLELVEGQSRLFEARRASLQQQIDQLRKRSGQIESQIGGIDAQLSGVDAQLGFIADELSAQRALLEKGLTEQTRVLALQREDASLMGENGRLRAARAEAEGKITETDIQIVGLQVHRQEEATTELRDIAAKELELTERRRALLDQIGRLEIRAPTSGVVMELQVKTPGAVLRPAEPVLFIVPQDRPLIISAKVPPLNIDELRPGQPVRLHFSALPSRGTPELMGRVSVISADAIVEERTNTTFYRVEVSLSPEEMAKLAPERLVPGMPVEVFILTTERTLLDYLTRPLADQLRGAFRES